MVFQINSWKLGNFQTVVKYFLKHYGAQISLLFITGDLKCVRESLQDSSKMSKFTRICMENHSSVTGSQELFFCDRCIWNKSYKNCGKEILIQILLLFGGRYNRPFSEIRVKIHNLLNFNMLFQFQLSQLSKSELFSCLQKVDHVTNYCKRPRLALSGHPGLRWLQPHRTLERGAFIFPCLNSLFSIKVEL